MQKGDYIVGKIIILGHENPDVDSIISGYILEKILKKKGYDVEFIIPEKKIEKDSLDICIRNGLNPTKYFKNINFNDRNKEYILVDHNERELAGNIIAIIDHHPTTKKIKLKNYYNKKISSTALYIAISNLEYLDEFDLKLVILATFVDTASFNSTKSRKKDKEWIIDLCKKYNWNYEDFYKEGLCLTLLKDIESSSLNGLKKYNLHNKKIECSYIQIEEIKNYKEEILNIINFLKLRIKKINLDAFVFIVHDMKCFKTKYYLITNEEVSEREYQRYTSRGNTIIPEIENLILDKKI